MAWTRGSRARRSAVPRACWRRTWTTTGGAQTTTRTRSRSQRTTSVPRRWRNTAACRCIPRRASISSTCANGGGAWWDGSLRQRSSQERLHAAPCVGDLAGRDRAEVLAEERMPHLGIHLDLEVRVLFFQAGADRRDLVRADLLVVAAEHQQQRYAHVVDLFEGGLAVRPRDRTRDALAVERDRARQAGERRREERRRAAVAEAPRRDLAVAHERLRVEPVARGRDVFAHVLRVEHRLRVAAAQVVDRQTHVARRRDLIGDALDLVVEAVDALEHDHGGPRAVVQAREVRLHRSLRRVDRDQLLDHAKCSGKASEVRTGVSSRAMAAFRAGPGTRVQTARARRG